MLRLKRVKQDRRSTGLTAAEYRYMCWYDIQVSTPQELPKTEIPSWIRPPSENRRIPGHLRLEGDPQANVSFFLPFHRFIFQLRDQEQHTSILSAHRKRFLVTTWYVYNLTFLPSSRRANDCNARPKSLLTLFYHSCDVRGREKFSGISGFSENSRYFYI